MLLGQPGCLLREVLRPLQRWPTAFQAVSSARTLTRVGHNSCLISGRFISVLAEMPSSDVVVGPGNKYVTAAKSVVSADVSIDMLAGPSECLVVADSSANPSLVAADLLAQAEHDTDAIPILVTTDEAMVDKVNQSLSEQIQHLSTRSVASESVALNGAVLVVDSIDAAADASNQIAPEHLELHIENAASVAKLFKNYGGSVHA